MVKRELNTETINRLRTWLFLGVVVCGGLIVGLSSAVWSSSCGGGSVLGFLSWGFGCETVSGTDSHVLFGFGDGIATLVLGFALLAICALALGFRDNARAVMVLATLLSLITMVVVASAAFTYMADERFHATQSLLLMMTVTAVAPILSASFVWLDEAYQDENLNGDTEAWA